MQNTSDLIDLLNHLAVGGFHRLSVVKTAPSCWQANLQVAKGDNAFRVEHGATAAEAIAALFAPVPVFVAALPLPPCPVPLP